MEEEKKEHQTEKPKWSDDDNMHLHDATKYAM